jgi:hypothetical protein
MASQPTSNLTPTQPGPQVFCCQNILNQTPIFEVGPNPNGGLSRQREDRLALQELSSQPRIIMAFNNIRDDIFNTTPVLIQIQDSQRDAPRFFASTTAAEEGTARTWGGDF